MRLRAALAAAALLSCQPEAPPPAPGATAAAAVSAPPPLLAPVWEAPLGRPRRLATDGKIVAVVDGSGLRLLAATGAPPRAELGRLPTPGLAFDVVLVGGRALVADLGVGLAIVDV